MEHFLKIADLTESGITDILNLADQLKYELKNDIPHNHLRGKTLGMIFRQASTRTRVSFEVGMIQLGGYPLFLSSNDLQMEHGELVKDTARVLSRYLDGIMIRTHSHQEAEDLARYGDVPIINGLTEYAHPCQILADFMTIREKKRTFRDLKIAYIGAGHNLANSLIVGCLKLGINIAVASPIQYGIDSRVLEFAENNINFSYTENPQSAVENADVVFTDLWSTIYQKSEAHERAKVLKKYQINEALLSYAKKDVMVLHGLPAHRGEEISEEVFEKYAEDIFQEAENRLHAQKAVLVKLLGKQQ